MGCDIHSVLEVKQDDGTWKCLTPFDRDEVEGIHFSFYEEPIKWRNYKLFSMLANVRNGYGFAGSDTGDELVPISLPKGVPDDASPEVKEWVEQWYGDGHSHSWLTLQEILGYDFHRVVKLRGWLSAQQFFEWENYGRGAGEDPKGWCSGVTGPNIRHISEVEMRRRIQEAKDNIINSLPESEKNQWQAPLLELFESNELLVGLAGYYCLCEWTQSYLKLAGEIWTDTIPMMIKAAREHNVSYDAVRVCFFFDN